MKRNIGTGKSASSVRSFYENLTRKIMRHTVLKLFELEILMIGTISAAIFLWNIYQCHNANRNISRELLKQFGTYSAFLESVADVPAESLTSVSTTWNREILKAYRKSMLASGIEADLYILDSKGKPFIGNRGYPSEEEKNAVLHHQTDLVQNMHRVPKAVHTEISHGTSRSLFLGCFMPESNQYALLQMEEKAFGKLFYRDPIRTVLVQESGWALSPQGMEYLDAIHKLKEDFREKSGLIFTRRGVYYAVYTPLDALPLGLYSFLNFTRMSAFLAAVLATSLILVIAILLVSRGEIKEIATEFSLDIQALEQAFSKASDGDLDQKIHISSSVEMKRIGNGYNNMLESLKKQMYENEALAKVVSDEQSKQLGSQFTAHFLFNTLDNIYYMCRLSPEVAETMVLSLSDLLRYNTQSPREKVSIAEDFHYIRLYLEILKIRFRESFTYQIFIEEGISWYLLPKLLIQPILENALKYGRIQRETLTVSISVSKEKECILITCADNGMGMEEDKLRQVVENLKKVENESNHLGLYNLQHRIQLTYGQEYGMKLLNRDGFTVEIRIPMETESDI